MAKELEHWQQQEELLAAGCAEAPLTQQAWDRLATAERQIAADGFRVSTKVLNWYVLFCSPRSICSNLATEGDLSTACRPAKGLP